MQRVSRLAAWGGVFILFLGYCVAFIDRQILSLLVQPIRADLQISDTQFSLLQGFAFALFYAVCGLPIGRLVDRGHRALILAAGMALWSLFTCLCGLSRNFHQLFFFRMGVGAGEATVVPVTYSLIADYFPPERRGLALGLFGSGVYFGMGGSMVVGGMLIDALEAAGPMKVILLGELQPWQTALLIVGTPGIFLAMLALFLPEPRRSLQSLTMYSRATSSARAPSRSAWNYYRSIGSAVALHHLTAAFISVAMYAALAWTPEHFRRTFDVPLAQSAIWAGAVILISGSVGVITGGLMSDRALKSGIAAARMKVLLAAALLAIPASLLLAFAPGPASALIGLGGVTLFISMLTSVGAAGVQELMPSDLRGFGAAVYQLTVNLIALTCGPISVAILTDYVFADDQKLYVALGVAMSVTLLIAAALAFAGLRPYERAAKRALERPEEDGLQGMNTSGVKSVFG